MTFTVDLSFLVIFSVIVSIACDERPSIINGGWATLPADIVVPPGPCNVDLLDLRTSQDEFLRKYAYHQPAVFRDVSNNDLFRALTEKNYLIKLFGSSIVKLSAANSYSYEKRDITFKDYCDKHLYPQNVNTLANETFYMFGDNDHDEWKEVLGEYTLPPYNLPRHLPALSFGVAGPGSGVPFHFHGPGFAEMIHGRKRWFLTPPDVKPAFHPNETTLQWFNKHYPRVKDEVKLWECTIRPGEMIYFPDKWWHATLNLDTAVFISTFLSP